MSTAQEQTALAFIAAFSTLNPATFTSLCTTHCTHHFLPTSINMRSLSVTEFASHISTLSQVLRSFPVTATKIVSDEKTNKVVVYAESVTEFWDGVKDEGVDGEEWNYRGEYVFMFEFEDAKGEEQAGKITKVVEFVDSKGTERLRGLMKRARENKTKRDAGKES